MGEMNEFRPHWSPVTKIVISLLLLALFIYCLFRFSIVLRPLILAFILAYLLAPVVNFLQGKLSVPRWVATLGTYLILLVILIALPVIITPTLVTQFSDLTLDLQNVLSQVETWLGHTYSIAGYVVDMGAAFKQASGSLQGVLEPFIGQSLALLVEVISSLVWVIFIFIVSAYLVKDGPQLREYSEKLVPPGFRPDFIRIRDEISQIWSAFFRGQLVLILVVAVLFTTVGFLLGLPFALALGLLAGLLELLPSVGHGIWLVIAAPVALFAGSKWIPIPNWAFMLLVIGLHLLYQQFDLNYLIPRIVGRRVHLPPLVVILGIVTGAVLAGVLGILLAAPTISSARVIGRYIYANLFDLDPFPPSTITDIAPPNPQWWRRPSLH